MFHCSHLRSREFTVVSIFCTLLFKVVLSRISHISAIVYMYDVIRGGLSPKKWKLQCENMRKWCDNRYPNILKHELNYPNILNHGLKTTSVVTRKLEIDTRKLKK